MSDKKDQNDSEKRTVSNGVPESKDTSTAESNVIQFEKERKKLKESDAVTDKRRASSTRKIEANRRNSRKSTGPKTATGKKTVAKNAVKHGFFAKFLLVQHPDGKETQKEYEAFYICIRDHYQPADWLEEMFVEKIAILSWRQRRLLRCESGQISRALSGHSFELQQSAIEALAHPDSAPLRDPETDAITDHLFLLEAEELNKLLRYEGMMHRQLNEAMRDLAKLQAHRKGGPILS